MKTTTINQFHDDFARVLGWVEQGEEVQITKRRSVVARLLPPVRKTKNRMPDFMARLKADFPAGVPSGKPASQLIHEGRGES